MGLQGWKDAERRHPEDGTRSLPETLKGNEPQFLKEYFDYYRTPRGFHTNSVNSNGAWSLTNSLSFMNMPILSYVKEISPRSILLIVDENADSIYFSEDIFKAANQPKELMIIPNPVHIDLYDRMDIIPFDKLERFFSINQK